MNVHGVMMVHGYGVRGSIWSQVAEGLGGELGPILCPDIEASDRDELQTKTVTAVTGFTAEAGGPVLLVGHSLGAALAALAANRLGPAAVAGVFLIAPPFGTRDTVPGPLLRFLLRTRLLPPALVRPRFFSSHTPTEIQKTVFRAAVPEARDVQRATFEKTWFHTELLTRPLPVPALVLASEADQIVPSAQSCALAEVIDAPCELLPGARGVGHDDFFASPAVAAETAARIVDFAASTQ